jgi:hypothetical protein
MQSANDSCGSRQEAENAFMDWHELDPSRLFEVIRDETTPPDAEQMVWALDHIFAGARIDPQLLDHLATASVCALAFRDSDTPRAVLERLFRRAISDSRWRTEYSWLLNPL